MVEKFRQVLLSQEQLDYGFWTRRDRPWPKDAEPIPLRKIAQLAIEPEELEARLGLRFQESFDINGLGPVRLAVLDLPSGRRIALFRYDPPHVLLAILERQYSDSHDIDEVESAVARAIPGMTREALEALDLSADLIEWQHPSEYEAPNRSPAKGWPGIVVAPSSDPSRPAVSAEAVSDWLRAKWRTLVVPKPTEEPRVESIEYLTAGQLRERDRIRVYVGDDRLVCLVRLRGTFVWSPPPEIGEPGTFRSARLVFDAQKGTLLCEGIG